MEITATTGSTGATATSAERGLDAFKSEDFFKLLVTELQQQDPFEPTETSDMIGQVSQIRSIEVSNDLTDVLASLTNQQQTSGVSDLLGKFISARIVDSEGTAYDVAGVVTGVRFEDDGAAVLELDTGESVLASDVEYVTSIEAMERLLYGDAATDDAEASDDADNENAEASTDKSATAKHRTGGLQP
jgi:flagellar basal-body rod modification protein FlgD